MGRYFSVYVKYIRDEEEERIFRFVNDMVADAAANGVSLHVAGLLGRDGALAERTREVFDEAKRIADSHGIDITLPEIIPRSVRRCDFVEEGSAFVSWDGSVHPCHFLWHRFRCYLGGVENNVKPFIFGSLEANGLLDIWNGPAFRSFRENVLRYDFPFCYDCNFALCDLVQDEDFIHDCYVSAVPCAACLWCTQLFQCMR
jgi:MoaA/NifB/PqqE/SkfB family radical SAM enzyme